MAVIINVYKTSYYLDAYSVDGDLSDPIFKYPPISFDGVGGQARDVQLFLRNDGDLIVRDLLITPTDKVDSDESTWMKLATTQGGLDAATPGAALSYGSDINPNGTYIFWLRTTVPAATDPEDKTDLCLRITCNGYES